MSYQLWEHTQYEIDSVLVVPSPIARNTRINSVYADIYLDNEHLYWPGVAAFSSKQVGCIMRLKRAWLVRDIIAAGNRAVFEEMGLLLRFCERARMTPGVGLTQAQALLAGPDSPIKCDKFRAAAATMMRKMRAGGKHDYWVAAVVMAEHEQGITLQDIVYQRFSMRWAIRLNKFTADLLMPIAIHFVSECDSGNAQGKCLRFGSRRGVLSNAQARIEFAKLAINKLIDLTKHGRQGIRDSLREIRDRA